MLDWGAVGGYHGLNGPGSVCGVISEDPEVLKDVLGGVFSIGVATDTSEAG